MTSGSTVGPLGGLILPSAELVIGSEADQLAFGARFAERAPRAGLVFLEGDLGAGKTTWVRGALRHWGVGDYVRSPTFTLVETYQAGGRRVFHFNLYRLVDPEEIEYLGVRDYLAEDALCFFEWPSRAAGYLPEPALALDFHYLESGSGRRIVYRAYDSEFAQCMREAAEPWAC